MQVFWIIFQHELLLSLRQLSKVLANFLFFLIFLTTFFLISSNQANINISTIIWLSLLSCLIFSSAEFLKKDFEDGTIEQVIISCENFEVFILAKIFSNWFSYCFPILMVVFFMNVKTEFLIIILLASITINFICCFCGSLSILGNSAPMIATIALPLIIPILLVAQGDFSASIKIILGLGIFLGAILTLATAKIVKIAAE